MELQPEAYSHWGQWGSAQFCPEESWAQGVQLKVEFDQGDFVDDSCLNAVQLKCFDKKGNYTGGVKSFEGGYGTWMSAQYCSTSGSNFLTGIRLRSEEVRYSIVSIVSC